MSRNAKGQFMKGNKSNCKGPNKKINKGSYYELILTGFDGKITGTTKVDKYDYDKIKYIRWCRRSEKLKYAVAHYNGKSIELHRFILGLKNCNQFIVVDHINQDGFDNRHKNLRLVDRSTNSHNSNKAKGYSFNKSRGVYSAEIMVNGKRIRKHGIKTKKEAIKIRKKLYEQNILCG